MASTKDEREAYRNRIIVKFAELADRINAPGMVFDSPEWRSLKGRMGAGTMEWFMCDYDVSFQEVTGEWMKENHEQVNAEAVAGPGSDGGRD